jgi:tight adherence protein B
MIFAILGPVIAKIILIVRTSRRRAKFADQLDDTLQLMASSLRAGHGLQRSIDAIATELDAPMSEELTRVVNETRLGRNVADSLLNTAERMESDDFLWTAQAIAVNQETGGNLSEVLSQIATTIRERNQIQRQVRALSAEGKLSGWILIAMPIALFTFFVIFQPAYGAVFFGTLVGWIAIAVGILLLIIGTIWMLLAIRVRV